MQPHVLCHTCTTTAMAQQMLPDVICIPCLCTTQWTLRMLLEGITSTGLHWRALGRTGMCCIAWVVVGALQCIALHGLL